MSVTARFEDGRIVRRKKLSDLGINGDTLTVPIGGTGVVAPGVDARDLPAIDDVAGELVFTNGQGQQVNVEQIVEMQQNYEALRAMVQAQEMRIVTLESTLQTHEISNNANFDARLIARIRKVEEHLRQPVNERDEFIQNNY